MGHRQATLSGPEEKLMKKISNYNVILFTWRGQAQMAAVTVERKTEVGKVWLSEGMINLTNDQSRAGDNDLS